MAEGGYDFENPEFDRDYYDDDDIDDKLPMVPEESTQTIISNQSKTLEDLRGELRESALKDRKRKLIKIFYDEILKRYRIAPNEIDYSQFSISDDGKILFWVVDDKKNRLTAKQGQATFLSLGTLANEYNKIVGHGGTQAIRNSFDISYRSEMRVRPKTVAALNKVAEKANNAVENIPLQDFSSQKAVQETVDTANDVDTVLQTLFDLPDAKDFQTQTEGLNLRELQGLDKALQSIRGELVNNLAKLTDIDKDIAKEKRKLGETEDEINKKDIKARLKNLEDEKAARLEAASANKEALRGQINRIKETINKVLKEDASLGERLKTLFREQGITIISVLTAIGMIIGVIVEAVIPTNSGTVTPPKPPSSKGGAKEWVKKQLHNLGRLLANLAGKAAAALPGVIGSIVSWLLSTTGKVINWF